MRKNVCYQVLAFAKNKLKMLGLATALLTGTTAAHAQYERSYVNNLDQSGYSIAMDANYSNYAVAGTLYDIPNNTAYIHFKYLNAAGNTLVDRMFIGNNKDDRCFDIKMISQGRFLLTCKTRTNMGGDGLRLLYVDAGGNIMADYVFSPDPSTNHRGLNGLSTLIDGNYAVIVGGMTVNPSISTGPGVAFAMKVQLFSNTIVATRLFNTTSVGNVDYDVATRIKMFNGRYYVTGSANMTIGGVTRQAVMSMYLNPSNLTPIWIRNFRSNTTVNNINQSGVDAWFDGGSRIHTVFNDGNSYSTAIAPIDINTGAVSTVHYIGTYKKLYAFNVQDGNDPNTFMISGMLLENPSISACPNPTVPGTIPFLTEVKYTGNSYSVAFMKQYETALGTTGTVPYAQIGAPYEVSTSTAAHLKPLYYTPVMFIRTKPVPVYGSECLLVGFFGYNSFVNKKIIRTTATGDVPCKVYACNPTFFATQVVTGSGSNQSFLVNQINFPVQPNNYGAQEYDCGAGIFRKAELAGLSADVTNLVVSPNPGQGTFNLTWSETLPQQLNMTITNVLGQVVATQQVTNKQQVSTQLPKGIYMITVYGENGTKLVQRYMAE